MFSIRSIVALAIALSTFWIVGCTSTQTVPEATSGPVIDAAPALLAGERSVDGGEAGARIFADDVHLTDRGAALLAALVATELEAQGLLED